ncbi:hypothetical protein [Draconibacterium mangrovi]|uniref:hypothetical protein n=1 Tax=Draconibacterium mangrovi TaxID=2697469 RepID=UPI0013CFE0E0|nr:hypothetical protein [Draconibacterium mangrovi]
MKSISKELIAVIVFAIVAILLVDFFFDKKDKEIVANGEYAIAHIIKRYEYGEKAIGGKYGAGASLESVDFSYKFKGQIFKANCTIDNENGFDKTVNDYLLIVDKDNPNRFILLFDYPIKDEKDFREVITKHENENIKNVP